MKIQSWRDLQTTQNSWDEVNLSSIQGVCVGESVAASTSSVRRITKPVISHPPSSKWPRAVLAKRAYNDEGSLKTSKLAAAPSTQPASISKSPVAVHNSSSFFPVESTELQLQSVIMEDLIRKKQRQLLLRIGLNQQNSEVGKEASKAKSLFLRNVPEPLCYG